MSSLVKILVVFKVVHSRNITYKIIFSIGLVFWDKKVHYWWHKNNLLKLLMLYAFKIVIHRYITCWDDAKIIRYNNTLLFLALLIVKITENTAFGYWTF